MKFKKLITISFFSIFLFSCASIPPVDFNVEGVGMVNNRKNIEMKSLTVGFAPQSQQKVVNADASIPPIWRSGLIDALNRSLIFKDDQKVKVNLSVRIVEFVTPKFGGDMETKVGAIYEIIDRESGALLFSEVIESRGIVPFNYAFLGLTRSIESWNRAVRNNIAGFINRLDQTDLSKPTFSGS